MTNNDYRLRSTSVAKVQKSVARKAEEKGVYDEVDRAFGLCIKHVQYKGVMYTQFFCIVCEELLGMVADDIMLTNDHRVREFFRTLRVVDHDCEGV